MKRPIKVWYSTPNFQSWMNGFVIEAERNEGISLDKIETLSRLDEVDVRPDYLALDPAAITEEGYWDKLKTYAKNYPDVKFLVSALGDRNIREIGESKLGELDNVEIMDLSNSGKQLCDILDDAKGFSWV